MAKVFIGNLSDDAKGSDVEDFFRKYGRLREITLKNGFGFVEFDDRRDAEDAVRDLNGQRLAGDRVVVELAGSELAVAADAVVDVDGPAQDHHVADMTDVMIVAVVAAVVTVEAADAVEDHIELNGPCLSRIFHLDAVGLI